MQPELPSTLRAEVTVRAFQRSDAPAWDAFVASCAAATFFHLSAWQGLMEEVFRHRTHYLLAERDGRIVAILPLAEVRSRLFGHALTSLPFCVYGGPVGEADGVAALDHAADELARQLGVAHLEYRHIEPTHAGWPRQDMYVTFRKELLPEVEDNMLAIPRKQRAMVRKGIKNGLVAEIDDTVERFFALYADNVRRHGTPALPKKFFARLKQVFGEQCEILTVISPSGAPLSSVLSFYFRDEVLPYYAGDAVAARECAANDFKYWALMQRAVERDIRVFDYGRSKVGTGPYAFKKNWGFEPTPLNYEYRLYRRDSVPQNNPLNPKYRLFIALWKRLPLPVANALGPHIVRNLG